MLDDGTELLGALGDIGDFLGGNGVVVTLAYLAIQIRRNTQAVNASAFDSISTAMAEGVRALCRRGVVARVQRIAAA